MVEYSKVKDSGARQKFSTGAVRDIQNGKGRYDLISPIFLRRLAKHYENGAVKYGDRNWEKGIPIGRFLDSASRHINEYREGMRDEDHLAAAAWNIACIIHTEEMIERGLLPKELMNIPSYMSTKETDEIKVRDESKKRIQSTLEDTTKLWAAMLAIKNEEMRQNLERRKRRLKNASKA